MMKNMGICFSEQAVKVSNSHYANHAFSSSSNSNPTSIQHAVTCTHKVKLSNGKQFLINLTWSNPLNHGFSISVSDFPVSSSNKNSQNSVIILHKARGTKMLESSGSRIEVYWDLCRAQYDSGPEPINGFYIVVLVNSEPGLILGDMEKEISEIKKRVSDARPSRYIITLVSRTEYFSGSNCSVYSTRAKFRDGGVCHEIMIKCSYAEELEGQVLCVYIDKKRVVQVKRLEWNFRGNQNIFLDGVLVDFMWDLHDWFFTNNPTESSSSSSSSGNGVFLFRTRSGLDSRLWLEEKDCFQQEKLGFSLLLICACNNPD
ncbi:hypothetical protein ABFX02_12G150900 [Erythranthe guttata]|nr:PREDICTED: uncharacterized protein LOC105956506 [Erythranthe guttata]|eukprot:XP_012835812.1 PREDICTED: uncharacterized protein LOC105956506 [Erythranthe guttata]